MASRKKKTSKGKREAAFSLGASSEAAGKNKGVVRILIMVVLVVGVFEAINLLRTGDTPKDFKVQTIQKVVGEEKPCGHFTAWGIAPVGKDKVLVTDQENSRLLEFDRKGNFLKSWGKKGTGLKNFMEPSGMTSDNSGNAYVMDTWNGFIKGYDENGTQTLTIDLTKFKNFYGPRGIAFDGHNFVVADTGNHRIAIVSP
ncbi:MAG TPA: NHL repeat-containing protein, partial [bacterium]